MKKALHTTCLAATTLGLIGLMIPAYGLFPVLLAWMAGASLTVFLFAGFHVVEAMSRRAQRAPEPQVVPMGQQVAHPSGMMRR